MTADRDELRVFIVAGEPSGDLLGGRLIRALAGIAPVPVRYAGVGGANMAAAGFTSLFPLDDLSIMGVFEVLPKLPLIRRRWRETAQAARSFAPHAIVTIDAPGFNDRVAKRLIAAGEKAPRIHYVAPQVWAWRAGRVRRMPRLYDHLMALFGFEVDAFRAAGIPTTFVGHPAIEALHGNRAAFRARHAIPDDAPVLAVLPGSRRGEVSRLLPHFRDAVAILAGRHPALRLVFPTVSTVEPLLRAEAESLSAAGGNPPVVVVDPVEKPDAFAAADAALTASGTATLELAIAGVPMVIAYRVMPLTAWIGRRTIKVAFAGLPNLLAGRGIVPELLQERCRPDLLAQAIEPLLFDPGARRAQIDALAGIAEGLAPPDGTPSRRAAEVVLELAGFGPSRQYRPTSAMEGS